MKKKIQQQLKQSYIGVEWVKKREHVLADKNRLFFFYPFYSWQEKKLCNINDVTGIKREKMAVLSRKIQARVKSLSTIIRLQIDTVNVSKFGLRCLKKH